MQTVIVSDLHLGSAHTEADTFSRFVRDLPPDTELILNGDIVNRPHRFVERHHAVLDLLRDESARRPVIWVRGNHDKRFELERPGNIRFVPDYNIGKRLVIVHGHQLDWIMPCAKPMIIVVRHVHALAARMGLTSGHVAFYAKRWYRLYLLLTSHIRANAARYAKRRGYAAIACGHTHFVEDAICLGIRYVNTGAWTEEPLVYAAVDETGLELRDIRSHAPLSPQQLNRRVYAGKPPRADICPENRRIPGAGPREA